MLFCFFGYILPVPIIILGFINPLYGYSWMLMWTVIVIGLAIREDLRRNKAQSAKYKLIYNPNAVKEYMKMLKPKGK